MPLFHLDPSPGICECTINRPSWNDICLICEKKISTVGDPEMKIKSPEVDELLLDVLFQACSDADGNIDNMCISAYEDACDYLTKKGYLTNKNGRIYSLRK